MLGLMPGLEDSWSRSRRTTWRTCSPDRRRSNTGSWAEGEKDPPRLSEVNTLIATDTYSDADKVRMWELLVEFGVYYRLNQNPAWAWLRKNRGSFDSEPRDTTKDVQITATGRMPLFALVTVAGRRWTVEEGHQTGKAYCGLDQRQVRRWVSWHRWTTLSMLAHAFLAVLAATERSTRYMTYNEIQHLFSTLIAIPNRDGRYCLHWSHWRQSNQHHAQTCHYLRRNSDRP